MKLDYSDLISPFPLPLENVGNLKAIKLRDIFDSTNNMSYFTYALYVNCLSMKPEEYFERYQEKHKGEPELDVDGATKFDLLIFDDSFRSIITEAINFFFIENFVWDEEKQVFLSIEFDENNEPLSLNGIITRNNYLQVVSVILQRVHVFSKETEVDDVSKIKSKRARKIAEKLNKRRKEFEKAKRNSKNKEGTNNLTLPNIISSVAAKSFSLNWVNIWDITVFQLFDEFERLQILDQYDIMSTQVSVWGDKEKKFKFGAWNSNIYD